ncbi:ferredoxin [Kitasatospora brasiliensis]|uniref:ferredoxin n=1 Tax=Kitasatospora brasiliensis TaxID=3058040 RepID=UPI00292D1E0C|nr:ferredoxin [Kitasatospora sp. K002]
MSAGRPAEALVTADRDACIGAAQCAYSAPDVFDQDDDGYVLVRDPRPGPDAREAVLEAVDLCPARAILFREAADGS